MYSVIMVDIIGLDIFSLLDPILCTDLLEFFRNRCLLVLMLSITFTLLNIWDSDTDTSTMCVVGIMMAMPKG